MKFLLTIFCSLFILAGCGRDTRVTTAEQRAVEGEDNAIKNHMQMHAAEQKALFNAQAADIKFRTDLNVAQATAIARANPAVATVDKLAADITRSYTEAQMLRDQAAALIANFNAQLAIINQEHVVAQTIFQAVAKYDATPDVTATGVATVAVDAASQALAKKSASAVPAPTSSAEPVPPPPGQ